MRFAALLFAMALVPTFANAELAPELVQPTAGCLFGGCWMNLHHRLYIPAANRGSSTTAQNSNESVPAFSLTAEPFEFHSGFWINLHFPLFTSAATGKIPRSTSGDAGF